MKYLLFPTLVVGLIAFPVNAGGQGQDHHHTRSATEPASYNSEMLNRQMTESPTAAGTTAEQPAEEVINQQEKATNPSRNTPYGNNKR